MNEKNLRPNVVVFMTITIALSKSLKLLKNAILKQCLERIDLKNNSILNNIIAINTQKGENIADKQKQKQFGRTKTF
jgi:hypothetical protein